MSPEELETSCGLGQWRPKFLQALASKKVYIFFYGAIGIIKVRNLPRSHRLLMLKLQGMQYSYMSSILTTIEKEFGIKSKETAYLNSGNEIAQILFIFFLPLMMKVKKRPLWCSIGMIITALGLYMMSLPHFISDHHQLVDNNIQITADKDFRHNISFAWSNETPEIKTQVC